MIKYEAGNKMHAFHRFKLLITAQISGGAVCPKQGINTPFKQIGINTLLEILVQGTINPVAEDTLKGDKSRILQL